MKTTTKTVTLTKVVLCCGLFLMGVVCWLVGQHWAAVSCFGGAYTWSQV
jgi:uncharacterized membrane protein YiaA